MPIHDIKDTAVHALSAASAMGLFASRPRVLALGEPTHGEAMLLGARNELFRQLVEQQGYRTIAIESDCLRALIVNDYVATGTGSLDDVMARGFSHEWFNAAAANRELVGWMRAFNDGRDACDRVRFAGLDGPLEMAAAESPRRALIGLFGYLAAHVDARLLPCGVEELEGLAGDDDRWTNPAAMMDPAQSVGRSAEAARLRLLADDLLALLEENTPHLLAATSRDEFDRARLYARTALGLLRYHHAMADASPARMTRMVGLRGQMMAGNLLALAADDARGPVLAHAHNSHLQRQRSTMRMGGEPIEWWGAGALAAARLGAGYGFLATALGTLRHQGVGVPSADTVEGVLYALEEECCVVDVRRLAASLDRGLGAHGPLVARESEWFGYAPLDPGGLGELDGIVFVRDVDGDGRG